MPQPVKTDGRIGSATPRSSLAGGFGDTNRNESGRAKEAKRIGAAKAAAVRENREHVRPPKFHKQKVKPS